MAMTKRILISILFLMAVAACFGQPVTITPPSATIEPGESVTLRASGAMYYQWSPAAGLSTTEGPVTVASPTVTTTYTCEGYAPGNESVVNGDFSQGNTGFTSSYEYNSNLWNEGTYYVDYDASLHHENYHGYGYGDNGNFMMVNGSISPNTNVWTEQISVNPNKWYAFSTRVCTLAGVAGQMALLQFSINGTQIGEIFSAPAQMMVWEQFYELWYSGSATTATITILNQNTNGDGNDFGLDDISFRELVPVGAPTCTVTVGTMSANDDYQQTCFDQATEVPFLDNDNLIGSCNDFNCQIIQQAAHGTAIYADDVMTYTPNTGYAGSDQFNYRISCGAQSAEATVFIMVVSELKDVFEGPVCESLTWHGHTFYHSIDTIWTVTGASAQGCDSVFELHLTVYPTNDTTIEKSICPNQLPYIFYGVPYYSSTDVTVVDTDIHGCDSTVRLKLEVSDYYVADLEEEYVCYETAPLYDWNPVGNYHFQLTESGHYIDTLPTDNCEGIFSLELHFMRKPGEISFDTVVCESYTWDLNDSTYTLAGDYYHSVPLDPYPCNQVYHLHLAKVEHEPQPEIESTDPDPHFPITATEFNVNRYVYFIDDHISDTSTWLKDSCEWSISKASWPIDVSNNKMNCTVYPMDWDADTVWLTFRAVNSCSDTTVRFWLKPSFYDIGEQDGAKPAFEVVPNPNNGQMELRIGNMEGKLSVKVYDMKGNRIDGFETVGQAGQTLHYDMQGRSSGIYFFVVTSREGTAIKKVVIER